MKKSLQFYNNCFSTNISPFKQNAASWELETNMAGIQRFIREFHVEVWSTAFVSETFFASKLSWKTTDRHSITLVKIWFTPYITLNFNAINRHNITDDQTRKRKMISRYNWSPKSHKLIFNSAGNNFSCLEGHVSFQTPFWLDILEFSRIKRAVYSKINHTV